VCINALEHTTMKAAARRNIEARKAAVKTHTSQVLTWCFKCAQPQPHTETIVGVSFGFMGARTCNVCGTNKDANKG
jgi:hypothetical protein